MSAIGIPQQHDDGIIRDPAKDATATIAEQRFQILPGRDGEEPAGR